MLKVIYDLPAAGPTPFDELDDNGVYSISGLRRAISTSYTIENQTINIIMKNTTGYWYNLLKSDDRYLKGRAIAVFNDDQLLGTFYIYDFAPSNEAYFTIKADTFTGIDYPLAPTITKASYNNAPDANIGKSINIIAGTLSDAGWKNAGQCIAYRVDANRFLAACHHLKTIPTGQVYDKTGAVQTFTIDNNADGYCYINCTSTETELYFNCQGLIDDNGDLITNPAYILQEIISRFTSLSISATNIQDAAAKYTSKSFIDNAILITSETTKAFFQKFSKNYLTYIYPGADGVYYPKVHDYNETAPVKTFEEAFVRNLKLNYDPKNIISAVRRQYYSHYRQNTFFYSPLEQSVTSWIGGILDLDLTYHRGNEGSLNTVNYYLFYRSKPEETITFDVFTNQITIDIGAKIAFQHDTGFRAGETRQYRVMKIENAETGFARITAMDIDSEAQGGITLLDETDDLVTLLYAENDPLCAILFFDI